MKLAAQITLTLTEDGQINVKAVGPSSDNKVVLLGLLEVAKVGFLNPPQEAPASPLLVARGSLPNGHR